MKFAALALFILSAPTYGWGLNNFDWENPYLYQILKKSICAHYCRNSKVCAYEGDNQRSVDWWFEFQDNCREDYLYIAVDPYLCPNEDDDFWDQWETDCR